MKLSAAILAFIVLFLSTQCMVIESGVAVNCEQAEETSCSKEKSCGDAGQQQSAKDCRKVCNPFMACSGCVYESSQKPALQSPSLLFNSVKNGCHDNLFISTYISSAWKPPEVI